MGKDERKKKSFSFSQLSQLFRPKVFDMDFPQKVFYGFFELSLLRNAEKSHKTKSHTKKRKKKRYLPIIPHLVRSRGFPKNKQKTRKKKNNPGKKQPTDFFFFNRCPLRRLWAVCGHAKTTDRLSLVFFSLFFWAPLGVYMSRPWQCEDVEHRLGALQRDLSHCPGPGRAAVQSAMGAVVAAISISGTRPGRLRRSARLACCATVPRGSPRRGRRMQRHARSRFDSLYINGVSRKT
jgi:hypothetical protein